MSVESDQEKKGSENKQTKMFKLLFTQNLALIVSN